MTDTAKPAYLDVTQEQGARFFGSARAGEVVMLNLLRFREFADYSQAPHLAPESAISGAQAYRRYMKEIEPLLVAAGGALLFAGAADHFLIGPSDEKWDFAMLVRQSSAQAFLGFASAPAAQAATLHRTAAVEDSRLLPLWPEAPLS